MLNVNQPKCIFHIHESEDKDSHIASVVVTMDSVNYKISCYDSFIEATAYYLTFDLISTHKKTEVNDYLVSIDVHKIPPAIAGFLEQNYCYKSIAIQILQDARQAPIPYNNLNYSPLGN